MKTLSDKQIELEQRINALQCEYAEFTAIHNKNLISHNEWIIVSRQITLEILELTSEFMNE
jgi:hypothetical protein